MYLSATDNSTLSGNEIVFNERYGIRLGFGSDSNLVFNNRLGWNNLSNGYDDSENNAWDNGVIGNAWSDYAGGPCIRSLASRTALTDFLGAMSQALLRQPTVEVSMV